MGAVYDSGTVESVCCRLRSLVQESFQKHLYPTAVFYADKLVCLNRDPEDLYILAECFFKNREYRRVLHLLQKHSAVTKQDDRLKLLAVQSLMECKEWDECLEYLEENTLQPGLMCDEDTKMSSVFALLRGKVYEITENQESALQWYKKAVEYDPYCHEALDRLVGNHLLTLENEVALLRGLRLHEDDEWLRHLYAAKLGANALSRGREEDSDVISPGGSSSPGFVQASLDAIMAAAEGAGDSLQERVQASCCSRQRRLRQATCDENFAVDEYPMPHLPAALTSNGYALAAQSTRYFYQGDYESCYIISKRVLEDDPYHLAVIPVYIASEVMLEKKSAVFYVAHQLVNAYPREAVAWFSAGCYYYVVKKYEHARRFFSKALALDHNFSPAWIAFGHAFAMQDESDQAMAAYRTASRLFPGSHLPWLFIGMEYLRTNSKPLAQQYLETARCLAPSDPHVLNEIAVVAFHRQDYRVAIDLFSQAVKLPGAPSETICSNLGHAYLRCNAYDKALDAFKTAGRLNPRSASVLTGIAFILQLQGLLEDAIEYYHRALSIQHDDMFASDMLNYAVQEAAERSIDADARL
eukprot:TRINITY_DN81828_c0_g1_i1.p1 TRINITY_DN81828_c0_g1~~TRINITY_DN81828_c0_g1_i1.p1  ORF type:complete len:583 (+),score=114.60 TRINITY_DN81828_c0_g1_i1:129-1877(+)